jgi:hypothetical protein
VSEKPRPDIDFENESDFKNHNLQDGGLISHPTNPSALGPQPPKRVDSQWALPTGKPPSPVSEDPKLMSSEMGNQLTTLLDPVTEDPELEKLFGKIMQKIKTVGGNIVESILGGVGGILTVPFLGGGVAVGIRLYRKRRGGLGLRISRMEAGFPNPLYDPIPTSDEEEGCKSTQQQEDTSVKQIREGENVVGIDSGACALIRSTASSPTSVKQFRECENVEEIDLGTCTQLQPTAPSPPLKVSPPTQNTYNLRKKKNKRKKRNCEMCESEM